VGQHRAGVEVGAVEVVALLDRLRVPAVQLRSLAGEEVLVERGASERVAEVVAAPRRLDDQQPPTRTRIPAARASSISSWTSRDLPTPASPPINAATWAPDATRSSASLSLSCSARRPTSTGLTRLAVTWR
jgi:hypothetical protein